MTLPPLCASTAPLCLQDCQQLDAKDSLRALRDQFFIPDGMIYLDGNSLGVMPKSAPDRIAKAVNEEWGQGLISSWNTAGWFDLPKVMGDKLAPLIGAGKGEVVVTDSTSVNLYKVLAAALTIAQQDAPDRRCVVSERNNFPTDLYIAEGLCKARGYQLLLVEADEIDSALTQAVAVLMLTHVNYRTGAMHDMAAVTAKAHAAGILTVWDLAHSAGAVPVDLNAAEADFSIGCGYKYLNGGPGAPAFVWVHPRHTERFWQPLSGWWGHAAPFQFTTDYKPAPGITRYLCGTQPILSLTGLGCGLDSVLSAESLGGMAALRQKSLALTDLFIRLLQEQCGGHDLGLVTPLEHAKRGSQVCLTRAQGAYAIVQALIARGVVGDFRAGDGAKHLDILRFGFTPLYIGFVDVWNAVEHLKQVLDTREWQLPRFNKKQEVT